MLHTESSSKAHYVTRPATEVWEPQPIAADGLWAREIAVYRPGKGWRGFCGWSTTQYQKGTPGSKEMWLRTKRVTEDNCVDQVNLRSEAGRPLGHCMQTSWHFTKAQVERGDGLALPAAPTGERVRHIALTEGVHVLMPLRASGWKRAVYQQQYRQAQQRMERARSPPPTTIALPASAAQAQVPNDPQELRGMADQDAFEPHRHWPAEVDVAQADVPEDELQVAAEPALWWGEALFLGDAKIRNEVVDAAEAIGSGQSAPSLESSIRVADCRDRLMQYAHAYVKMQREGRGAGLGPSPGGHAAQASGLVAGLDEPCRLCLSVAYGGSPGMAVLARQDVCEPRMVGAHPDPSLNLDELLKGTAPGPRLDPEDPSVWLLPLLQHAAAATAELGAASVLLPEGGVTVRATQVRVLPDNQMLEESSASGKMVVGAKWASTEPDMAFAMAGAGVAPEDIELPDLGSLWYGSLVDISVPSGYTLTTHADGGYIIAADHFGAALQPAPPGCERPWVCEWGVIGFGGKWARVRVFFRVDGWIEKWQVLEFFEH